LCILFTYQLHCFYSGAFSKDGIKATTNGSFVNCSSNHLTSFAVLVNVGDVSMQLSANNSTAHHVGKLKWSKILYS